MYEKAQIVYSKISIGKFFYSIVNVKTTRTLKKKNINLVDCVGVFAADPFRPSTEARWPSNASNKELGAFVKSGISPLSIPTFYLNN